MIGTGQFWSFMSYDFDGRLRMVRRHDALPFGWGVTWGLGRKQRSGRFVPIVKFWRAADKEKSAL